MAAVAEFRQTALFVPQHIAIRCSNSLVLGPVVIQPDYNAPATCSISASDMSGGEKGIFLNFMFIITIIVKDSN